MMRFTAILCAAALLAAIMPADAARQPRILAHGHTGIIPYPHTAAQAKAYPPLKTPHGLQHYQIPTRHAVGHALVAGGDFDPTNDTASDAAYFTSSGGYVQSTADRTDTAWGPNVIVASSASLHFNLNQPAKLADSLDGPWQVPFNYPAPLTASDTINFCGGPTSSHVQVYDQTLGVFLFDGTVTGIPPCP